MIGIKDVINAINTLLKANFTVKPSSKNIKEKIVRPSFYVDLEQNDSIQFNSMCKQNNLTIRIYYYPSDPNDNRIELLDVQEKLNNLFLKGLRINSNFYIYLQQGSELEFVTVDGVLQLKLELYYIQLIEEEDNSEYMEDLSININKN